MVKSSIILLIFISSGLFAQTDLNKCIDLLQRSEAMIIRQDSLINLLKKDIILCDTEKEMNKKNNLNCEISLKYIDQELRKERRIKRFWQVLGISGLTACLTTTILYITK